MKLCTLILFSLLINSCYEPARYARIGSSMPFESAARGDLFARKSREHRMQITATPVQPVHLIDTVGESLTWLWNNEIPDTIRFENPVRLDDEVLIYNPSYSVSYRFGYHFTSHLAIGTASTVSFFANTDGYDADKTLSAIQPTFGYWFSFGGPVNRSKKLSLEYHHSLHLTVLSRHIRSFTSPHSSAFDTLFIVNSALRRDPVTLKENSLALQYRFRPDIGLFTGISTSFNPVDAFMNFMGTELELGYAAQHISVWTGLSYYFKSGIASIQLANQDQTPYLSCSFTKTSSRSPK